MTFRWNPIRTFHWLCIELLAGAVLGFFIAALLGWLPADEMAKSGKPVVVRAEEVHKEVIQADASAPADQDGDGMPDTWETANGHDPTNPADAASDFDLDGLTALEEYIHGKSPLGKWSVKAVAPPVTGTGWNSHVAAVNRKGKVLINFTRDTSMEMKNYLLDTATSTWEDITPVVSGFFFYASDLNDLGTTTFEGWDDAFAEMIGLIRDADGTIQETEDENGIPVTRYRINNAGDWVGYSLTGATLASVNGELIRPDSSWGWGSFHDVNEWGEILGSYQMTGVAGRFPFIQRGPNWFFSTGVAAEYPFFDPSDAVMNQPRAINNFGEFTGVANRVAPPHIYRSYLYDGKYHSWGGSTPSSGVSGIDDNARVVAYGPNGQGAGLLVSDGVVVPIANLANAGSSTSSVAVISREGVLCFGDINDATVHVVTSDQDQDKDGMSDDWEDVNGLNKNSADDASLDSDGDGINNLGEYRLGTNPHALPAVDDGGQEIDLRPGIDTDGDGMPNIWEWENGLDYLDPADASQDLDRDNYSNLQEFRLKTDPRGAPVFKVREVGQTTGASSVNWTGTGFGGDPLADEIYLWGSASSPVPGGGQRPARWYSPTDDDEGSFAFYPSHGSQHTSLLARSLSGAVAASHSANPVTLVYWSSPDHEPISVPGTNTTGGSNTRSISYPRLSPSGTYLAGYRVDHQTGAGSHFIWKMPQAGAPLSLPVVLSNNLGVNLANDAVLHVNDHGHIAVNVTYNGHPRVAVWKLSPSGLVASATLRANLAAGNASTVTGISNSATPIVVGKGNKTWQGTDMTALAWDTAGTVTELNVPGGTEPLVTGISPAGVISGIAKVPASGGGTANQTFLAKYASSSWKIRPQGAPIFSVGHHSVTDSGEILGSSVKVVNGPSVPTLWRNGFSYPIELPASSMYALGSASGLSENGSVFMSAVRNTVSVRVILTQDQDTDGDGIPDSHENSHGQGAFNAADGLLDPDGDGLVNRDEYANGTNPRDSDSDSDGMRDGWEVKWGLNPLDAGDAHKDFDGDRVTNFYEAALDTPPTGLYRLDTFPLHSTSGLWSVAENNGATIIRREKNLTDASGQNLGSGWGYTWYGPSTPGNPRTTVELPFGAFQKVEGPDRERWHNANYFATADGKVTGYYETVLYDTTTFLALETSYHLIQFDPATQQAQLVDWESIKGGLISGGWTAGPNFSNMSPQGKRRILNGHNRCLVLNEQGVVTSELPSQNPLPGFTSATWSAINDNGDVIGLASPGSAVVFWNQSSSPATLKEIQKPAEWGSDPWGLDGNLLSDDARTVVYRTIPDTSGSTRKQLYLLDLRAESFTPISTPGFETTEAVSSLANGDRMVGGSKTPWQAFLGSTLLVKKLQIDGTPPQQLSELGWKFFGGLKVTASGMITGMAVLPDNSRLLAQLHPIFDADVDGMPDDWEKYWARIVLASNPNPDPEHEEDLNGGDLDPDIDYMGGGSSSIMRFGIPDQSEEEEDAGVQGVTRMRSIDGYSQVEPEGLWSQITAHRYPVPSNSEGSVLLHGPGIGPNSYGNTAHRKTMLNSAISWNSVGIEPYSLPRSQRDALMPRLTGYKRSVGDDYEKFTIGQSIFTIKREQPSITTTKRIFIERRKTVHPVNGSLDHELPPWEVVGTSSLSIPAGELWAQEARNELGQIVIPNQFFLELAPEENGYVGLELDQVGADLEVTTPNVALTTGQGPPSHRKISLFAAPVKDSAPSDLPESDTPPEEVYVDAYDRSLAFSTSFAWMPQGSSELPLGVTLRYNPTTIPYYRVQKFDEVSKNLIGYEESLGVSSQVLNGCFGVGFSSNLSAKLVVDSEVTSYTDKSGAVPMQRSRIERYKVDVIDSDGGTHKFTSLDLRSFTPEMMPLDVRGAGDTTLSWTDANYTDLVLEHKYGKKTYYKWAGGPPSFAVVTEQKSPRPGVGQGYTWDEFRNITRKGLALLDKVSDRFGNEIRIGVVDQKYGIRHYHKGILIPSGTILIGMKDGLVRSITDGRDKTTYFKYSIQSVGMGGIKLPVLSEVHLPDGGVRKFGMHVGFRKPKVLNPLLPGPADPLDIFDPHHPQNPFNQRPTEPKKKKKKWTTGDSHEMALAPYLTYITDASGIGMGFEFEEPQQVDAAKRVRINGKVDLSYYDEMPGAASLDSAFKEAVIAAAKREIAGDIAAEMAMKGFHKLPGTTPREDPMYDPLDPFKGDLANEDPYRSAEGIYFRYGLTSPPAVKKVTRPDVDGDGVVETMKISQNDNFRAVMLGETNPTANAGSSGLPADSTETANRSQPFLKQTTVTDKIGGTTYTFGDPLVASYSHDIPTNQGLPPGQAWYFTPPQQVLEPTQAKEMPPETWASTIIPRKLEISRGGATETFYFNPFAGMALAGAVDASGNTVSYDYGQVTPVPFHSTLRINNISFGKTILKRQDDRPLSESRSQNNPLSGPARAGTTTQQFGYSGELRTRVVDERGVITKQGLDVNQQLRTWEKVYASQADETADRPQRWESFVYGNPSFPMFVTEHRVKKIEYPGDPYSDPIWVSDLVTTYEADAKGRLWKGHVHLGGGIVLTTTHTYDGNGNKASITSPRGLMTSFAYDDMNRLKEVTYHDQTKKSYEYDKSGRKVAEIDENGNRTSFKYIGTFLSETRRHMGEGSAPTAADLVTRMTYDSRGRAISAIDPNGNVTATVYDSLDRPVLLRDAMGYETELAYDLTKNAGGQIFNSSSFKPTRTKDARGYVTEVTYNHRYKPVRTAKEYQFPAASGLPWYSRPLGASAVVDTVYDASGNPTDTFVKRQSDADLSSSDVMHTQQVYDALGRVTTTNVGSYSMATQANVYFTSTGLPWRTTDGPTLMVYHEKEYDGAGRVVKEWAPAALTGTVRKPSLPTHTGFTYSALTQTAYDADGNVIQITNPLGGVTDYHYDNRNRREKEELPLAAIHGGTQARPTIETTYDAAGNVETVTDPRGVVTLTEYDKANRPNRTVAAYGTAEWTETLTDYDKNGNVIAVTDPNDHVTRNAYDHLDRLIGSSVNPSTGNPGWPQSLATGDSVVANVYDEVGNLKFVADGEAQKQWTSAGWSLNKTAGHVTEFDYDGLNRVTRTAWDAGSTLEKEESAEYDAVVLLKKTDAANRETHFAYDSFFRLTTTSYPDSPGEDHTRYYHSDASATISDSGPGPLRAVWYSNGGTDTRDVTYTLNRIRQVISETSGNATHSYSYDHAGNRVMVRYKNKSGQGIRSLVTIYDKMSRVSEIYDCARIDISSPLPTFTPNPATDKLTSYTYDIGGNVRSIALPSGQLTVTDYDLLGRRRLITTTNQNVPALISQFDYRDSTNPLDPPGYDRAGNMRRVVETYSNFSTRTVINDYDRTNRLNRETVKDNVGAVVTVTEYEYDKASNRTLKDVAGGSSPGTWLYTYGNISNGLNANQLASYNRPSDLAEFTFTYDANGNRLKRFKNGGSTADATYTYDSLNRLIKFVGGGRDDDYKYDYRTRRVERDESGSLAGAHVQYSFSGGTSVQEYVPGQNAPAAEHIRGSDWGGGVGGILYTLRGGAASFCSYNGRGDVTSRTDSSGAVTWQATYEAFGTRTQTFGSSTERQTANTKEEDLSGLLNEGMRYRDLEAGVFITRDPAGFVDGPNVYTYVRQNPWTMFDPEGLSPAYADPRSLPNCPPELRTALEERDREIARSVTLTTKPVMRAGRAFMSRDAASSGAIPFLQYTSQSASAERAGEVLRDAVDFGMIGKGKGAPITLPSGPKGLVPARAGGPVVAPANPPATIPVPVVVNPNFSKNSKPGGDSAKDNSEASSEATGSGGTTSKGARREVMRQQGIPTSQQPSSQSKNASGREQSYEVPRPGGGTQTKSVQQQTLDSSHPGQGHWEAGKVKTDPLTGETRMNQYDRPKLTNDKSKIDYDE